MASAAK